VTVSVTGTASWRPASHVLASDLVLHSALSLVRPGRRALQSTMLDWARCDAVERASHRLSGAWTFKGTRVPVKALFENLEDGATVEQFLQWFPGVTRGQVEAVLEHTAQSLTEV